MNGKSENSLLDKVVEMLSPNFGIADGSGHVIYPNEGKYIRVPEIDKQEETFVEYDGFCFWSENSESLWFFDKSPNLDNEKNNLKKLLSLASEIYNTSVVVSYERRNSFFKQLLNGGEEAIDKESQCYIEYFSSLDNGNIYVVLLLQESKRNLKTNSFNDSIASIVQLMTGIFAEEDNCHVVKMSQDTVAVVIPLTSDRTYKNLLYEAEELKETIAAELMIDVNVSLGDAVLFDNIHYGYETALNALLVGTQFDLNSKCFSSKKLGLSRLFYKLDRETCENYLLEVFGESFVSLHAKQGVGGEADEIDRTISTYLDYNQNVTEASKALIIHRNTLNYRIEKFNKMTGLDCSKFEDGVKIKIGFLIMKHMNSLK